MSVPKVITNVDKQSLSVIKKDIASHGCILLYYWNQCGHCIHFKETWEKLKKTFGNKKQFYEIELSTIRQSPDEFKSITGFPTIVAFVGDGSKKEYYSGSRDFQTLSSFITKTVPDYKSETSKTQKPKKSKNQKPKKSKNQ